KQAIGARSGRDSEYGRKLRLGERCYGNGSVWQRRQPNGCHGAAGAKAVAVVLLLAVGMVVGVAFICSGRREPGGLGANISRRRLREASPRMVLMAPAHVLPTCHRRRANGAEMHGAVVCAQRLPDYEREEEAEHYSCVAAAAAEGEHGNKANQGFGDSPAGGDSADHQEVRDRGPRRDMGWPAPGSPTIRTRQPGSKTPVSCSPAELMASSCRIPSSTSFERKGLDTKRMRASRCTSAVSAAWVWSAT